MTSRLEHFVDGLGPQWDPVIYGLVFFVSLAEAAVFLGLIVPGETILLFAGYLAWKGKVNVFVVIVLAIAGAIAGDSIGYEVGRHFGDHLRETWVGRLVGHARWERARQYLREKGGRAVFVGRFVSVVRAFVPAAAGDSRLPYGTFLKWNVAGAVVWGVLHVSLGYLAGPSFRTVERWLGKGTWLVLALVVLGFVAHHFRARKRQPVDR